ncbi:30S ribosomal protein S9 [Candidatus Woesearchaeota archaeon]|nr:30S ribosomal protein S9 [Candidatus Woesearchaeota archaeon]
MKSVVSSGKRKRAIARASVREGTGIVRINNILIDMVEPKMSRIKMKEPLLLVGDAAYGYDIDVTTSGGGFSSQAEAGRLAIAKGLVEFTKSEKIREIFLKYDRQLLVADVRRKEPAKPNRHGQARAKRQKSYR